MGQGASAAATAALQTAVADMALNETEPTAGVWAQLFTVPNSPENVYVIASAEWARSLVAQHPANARCLLEKVRGVSVVFSGFRFFRVFLFFLFFFFFFFFFRAHHSRDPGRHVVSARSGCSARQRLFSSKFCTLDQLCPCGWFFFLSCLSPFPDPLALVRALSHSLGAVCGHVGGDTAQRPEGNTGAAQALHRGTGMADSRGTVRVRG